MELHFDHIKKQFHYIVFYRLPNNVFDIVGRQVVDMATWEALVDLNVVSGLNCIAVEHTKCAGFQWSLANSYIVNLSRCPFCQFGSENLHKSSFSLVHFASLKLKNFPKSIFNTSYFEFMSEICWRIPSHCWRPSFPISWPPTLQSWPPVLQTWPLKNQI